MCDQIKKNIQSRVQKKIRCKSIQSSEKIKQATQQFKIHGSEKKQDHLKIVLTCNAAKLQGYPTKFFLFIFKIS